MNRLQTIITGTGSYIPSCITVNAQFENQAFYDEQQQPIVPGKIVQKFEQITGIKERRYAADHQDASGMAAIAAARAIENAGVDPESIDQLIVAHNFGDIDKHAIQSDAVPSLASRIKHILGIKNSNCIPYDLLFGCPGWLQGVIQANAFMQAGMAKTCLVIGTETLSRVVDQYDRDSMIFSDGAGAVILESRSNDHTKAGFLGGCTQSFTGEELNFIYMGSSYSPDVDPGVHYMKMLGRKVYEFALKQVPAAMKTCMDDCGVHLSEVKKIFIHQANEKMDEAIVNALYKLYNMEPNLPAIMPMNIHELGNSSVATIPTLLDMVCKGLLPDHQIQKGDLVLFASVGAGMNINAACYRF